MKSTDNSWVPTPKQARFLSLPYSILEGFYAGALMAGKSDVLLAYPVIHKFHQNSKFKGIFFRRTYKELEKEIIPRSYHFYRQLGAKYNKNSKVWEFPSGLDHSKSPQGAGALMFFGHVENEDDAHNYDSMQINYAAFDELTSFTEWQYLYITLQRVRSPITSNLPAIVRSASNPGNIGHGWVRKRFIDPCKDGEVVIRNKGGLKRIYIPATIKDNPYVSPEYLISLDSLPEAEKQAKLYGNWDAYDGLVFDEFRDKKYPDEPDNALHVIPKFDIPEWWPKVVGMDWGYAPPAMTWIGYGAVSPYKQLYLYDEQWWQKTKIEEWCAQAKPIMDRDNPRVVKLCKSAGQDRGQEHTILQQVSSALGRNVELTSNQPGSRVAGKMLMHEYFRWKQKYVPPDILGVFDQEKADWLMRNKSYAEYETYANSFVPKAHEETNLPKMLVFNHCKKFIEAIKSCVYDKTNPQDVAEFPGDDPYDGGRYLVDAADRYFDDANREFKVVEQREDMSRRFEETQDMTAFYNYARKIESETRQVTGVRRYHRSMR